MSRLNAFFYIKTLNVNCNLHIISNPTREGFSIYLNRQLCDKPKKINVGVTNKGGDLILTKNNLKISWG